MNWNRLLTAVAAVCCLVAVGTVATTMDSSVTTEPEEAVEFDHLPLPTGAEESVGQLRRQVSTDAPGAGTGGTSGGASSAGGSGSQSDGGEAAEEQASQAEAAEGGDPKSVAGSQSDQQQSQSQSKKESGGSSAAPESLLERLLDLLRSLLAYLPLVLGILALGGAAYLLHDRFAGRLGGDDEGRATEGGPTLGEPAPRNDVSQAWYEMVERVGLAERYDLTPDEHAERAAERGVDPESAATLTRLFEEVRYGDAPVTDERRRRARERVQEIRAQARRLRTEGRGGSER